MKWNENFNKYLLKIFRNALLILKKFYKEYSDLLGLLKNLKYWLKYTKENIIIKN